jgi:hypothetical protein
MLGAIKRRMTMESGRASMVRAIPVFFVIMASAALSITSEAHAGGVQVNIGIPLVGYVAAPPVVAYPPPVVVERAPVVIEQPPPRVVYPQPVVVVEEAPRAYYYRPYKHYRPHKAKHYYKHAKHHRDRCDYDD